LGCCDWILVDFIGFARFLVIWAKIERLFEFFVREKACIGSKLEKFFVFEKIVELFSYILQLCLRETKKI
jgi:hypothetical protein